MLAGLTDWIAAALIAQLICALGVLVVAGWRHLLVFAALMPIFWAAPVLLASGHCLPCLDGLIYLPIGFLVVVCANKRRTRGGGPPKKP